MGALVSGVYVRCGWIVQLLGLGRRQHGIARELAEVDGRVGDGQRPCRGYVLDDVVRQSLGGDGVDGAGGDPVPVRVAKSSTSRGLVSGGPLGGAFLAGADLD